MNTSSNFKNGDHPTFSDNQIAEILSNAGQDVKEYIHHLEFHMNRMSDIGVALSKEKDMPIVLEMIIEEAMGITNSDGGTLYMVIDDETRLKFEIMQTKSKNFRVGGTSTNPVPEFIYPIKLYNQETGEPNYNMIAAYTALKGETVNIEDAYKAEGFDFSGTKAFDKKNDYRSQSFLTVPLKNHLDEIIGVIQLINAQDSETGELISFSEKKQRLVESLCSQAAVAITNNQLIQQLEELFQSFVETLAAAIDAKSKYTGGHCQRIPVITEMIAKAVNKTKKGPYAETYFDEDSMKELMVSAWLHDTGKVATPVHVVDKSTKLEKIMDGIDVVVQRFELLKRDEEIKFLKKQLKFEKEGKQDEFKNLRKTFKDRINQLDEDREFL